MLHPGNLLDPGRMRSSACCSEIRIQIRIQLAKAGGPIIVIDKKIRDAKITVAELTGKKK
jgi:hypothetical protein